MPAERAAPEISAREAGLVACLQCGKVHRLGAGDTHRHPHCVRCGARIASRKPNSIQRSWALLLTGIVLYIPANLYPIMVTQSFGQPEESTIIQGIAILWQHGSYLISGVVFVASMVVPILKFLVLSYLLWSVERPSPLSRREKVHLYHVTEFIGPWSMVDVFVVALLVALIQMGGIATVRPGIAAIAFAAMVAVTMIAATSFDPRLLWDRKTDKS